MISEYFSSFRVAAASAAEPAQEDVRLKYMRPQRCIIIIIIIFFPNIFFIFIIFLPS